MTLPELDEKTKKYRRKIKSLECNLFWEKLAPGVLDCQGRKLGVYDRGLYVVKAAQAWEVYVCEYERGGSSLDYIFYSEEDLYDFVLCYYKTNAESSYNKPEEQYDGIKAPKLPIPFSVFGIFIIVVALWGSILWLAIRQNSLWLFLVTDAPATFILISLILGIREILSDYRLAKNNFPVYGVKKWVEVSIGKIRRGESPEREYTFSAEKQGNYIRIETVRLQWQDLQGHFFPNDHTLHSETDAWKVISFINEKEKVHGIFSDEEMAYVYLFYLAAREYTDIAPEKWHWGIV